VSGEPKAPGGDIGIKTAQRLRMRRFGMALGTYAFAIVTTALTTRLGLGKMSNAEWILFLGLALFGNAVFFLLFATRANLRFSDPSLTWIQIFYSGLWGMLVLYALPKARPIVLMFYVPAFSFGMLRLTRAQYLRLVAAVMGLYAGLLLLEYFQRPQDFRIQYELFLFVLFGMLLTWIAFFGGFVTNIRRRLRMQNEEIRKAHEATKMEIEERKRAQVEKDNLIVELQEALKKVRTLSGLIPICSSCKKIRDDQGYWSQIESYIRTHSGAEFSHGICPECAKKLYPDLDIYEEEGQVTNRPETAEDP
jgi:hypothetical protein